ncbi:endo-1,4-beta-xylanase [Candidatus Poribacteria bacterium]|nr:endo-1,4-beta-xylanase [Candidatus Poribacteria bacterium]
MARPLFTPAQFISDRPDSIKKRIETTVACYRGNIDQWEVVSELVDRDLIKPCFQWARQMQPEATLILNGCIATTGKQQFCNLLREIEIVNDVPIDAIGLDICEPLGTHVAPAKLLRVLNQYAEFGLPIRMTQPMLPSDGRPIRSSWKQGAWTEREQANYAAALYTVCFSHPSVEAITWSIFADKADSQEECGLLRTKLYTKRIYKILRKLIHSEWRTRVHGSPNENGDFHFRGFYGQYQVTVIPGNRTPYTTTIHLSKNGRSDFDITLA